jgi:hypothetical protein
MANQNVPTHVLSGGISLKGNSYPDGGAQITYGGFAPTFEGLDPLVTPRTITAEDGLVFLITPSQATALDLPAAGASMNGRIYTFYVRDGGFAVTITAGGVAIPCDSVATPTVTAAAKSSLVYVIYSAGAVVSTLIQGVN